MNGKMGFDTSAFFLRIKRGSLQTVKPARARPARAMYGEILRKFTKTRARALRANYSLSFVNHRYSTKCVHTPVHTPVRRISDSQCVYTQACVYTAVLGP